MEVLRPDDGLNRMMTADGHLFSVGSHFGSSMLILGSREAPAKGTRSGNASMRDCVPDSCPYHCGVDEACEKERRRRLQPLSSVGILALGKRGKHWIASSE